jgi:hypothetical protein
MPAPTCDAARRLLYGRVRASGEGEGGERQAGGGVGSRGGNRGSRALKHCNMFQCFKSRTTAHLLKLIKNLTEFGEVPRMKVDPHDLYSNFAKDKKK